MSCFPYGCLLILALVLHLFEPAQWQPTTEQVLYIQMTSAQELENIGEDFFLALSDLTNNSRPIISSLTLLAQENINAAEYITKAVEKRIEKVSLIHRTLRFKIKDTNTDQAVPHHKLYALYLLDSISKNVGSPYTLLFAQKLFHTFTQAYLLVDDPTRKKFIDLFKTWKNATTSSGVPLFPDEPVNKIEQFLVKATSIHQQASQPYSSPVNVSVLLGTVDRLLYLINQRLRVSPGDHTISTKIEIITQLKFALQNERMTSEALMAVKHQLDEMTRMEERQLRDTPPVRSPQLANPVAQPQPNLANIFNSVQHQQQLQQQNSRSSTSTPPAGTQNSKPLEKNTSQLLNSILNIKKPSIKTPTLTPAPGADANPKLDLTSLLSNLQKQGLVNMPKTNPKIPSASLLNSLLRSAKSAPIPSSRSTQGEQQLVVQPPKSKLELQLSQFDISAKFISLDPTTSYTELFITEKPNKCGTCGKRFANTPEGQLKSREHLDWHFRINKKLREGTIVQSRSWYLDDEEFVQFRDQEMFGNVEATDESVRDPRTVKEERHYVVVPSDSDMSCVCGVCKDVLRAKFDDDLGEWIWDNAVDKNGRVFHYTCFKETSQGNKAQQSNGKRQREVTTLDYDMIQNVMKSVKLQDGTTKRSSGTV